MTFHDAVFTPEALAIIKCAERQARSLNADCIRTEHLVLAFLADPGSRCAKLLSRGGVTSVNMKDEIGRITVHEMSCVLTLPQHRLPMSAEFRNVIKRAYDGRKSHRDSAVTDFSLLAAVLEEGCSTGMYCLRRLYNGLDSLVFSFRNYLSAVKAPWAVKATEGTTEPALDERTPRVPVSFPMPTQFTKPYSRRARQAVNRALAAARQHNVLWMGTGYLLLGLAESRGSIACAVLESLGVSGKNVNALIVELTPEKYRWADRIMQPQPRPELNAVINAAAQMASEQCADAITTEHLLFALLLDRHNRANELLQRMQVDAEEIFDDLHATLGNPSEQDDRAI